MKATAAAERASEGRRTGDRRSVALDAGPRLGACGVALCALLGTMTSPALAQLTGEDIAALQERGRREGWTFTVRESEATRRPLSELCGAVRPVDWEDHARFDTSEPQRDLPASFDWRIYGGCTGIRDQGGCGSCWAFAAIGAVESAILIHDGVSRDLSEQWLVSCTGAGDCSGGWHTTAFRYMECVTNNVDPCGDSGAVPEADFPYIGQNGSCDCPYTHAYCIDDWFYVGSTSVAAIKNAIYNQGPVAACVYADDAFQGYGGGVFNACDNSHGTNHVIVLVGWNDNLGTNGVWVLRNSWGSDWGFGGYMYIEYGCSRVGDSAAYVVYSLQDCNGNGIADPDDITAGTSEDCNSNDIPDECEPDIPTDCAAGPGDDDCNGNGRKDLCDLICGISTDVNGNSVLDECEDCNGNLEPDEWESAGTIFQNISPFQEALDTSAPVAQDIRLPGEAQLDFFTVYYRSTGSTPGFMMVRFYEGGPGGGVHPQYPDGLIAEYDMGALDRTPSGFDYRRQNLDPRVWLPANLWMEVEIDRDAGVILRAEPPAVGFSQGMVYDRSAGELLDGPLYLSLWMVGVQCTGDCNDNGVSDECDLDCGEAGGACDVAGCGLSADCNSNTVPDECEIAEGIGEDCNSNQVPDDCEADSDGDTVIDDCEACPNEPALIAPEGPTESDCNDAVDNDCDGAADQADPDCSGLVCKCGDLDGDESVDLNDFATLATCYGTSGSGPGCSAAEFACSDLDGNGVVELSDFATFAILFGQPASGSPPNCG